MIFLYMSNIGLAQKAVVSNREGKILALRRTATAPSRPNTWDLPGGELDFGEDPYQSITREIREETGLEIEKLTLLDVHTHIIENNQFFVTIAYKCLAKTNKVTLSYEHDDYRWLTFKEFLKLESAPKLRQFVRRASEHERV